MFATARFADQAGIGVRKAGREELRAELPAGLLIRDKGEYEIVGEPPLAQTSYRSSCEDHRGHRALHVARAQPVEPAIAHGWGEWIGVPELMCIPNGLRVKVPVEDEGRA